MINLSLIAGVAIRSIGTEPSPEMKATSIVYRKLQYPVSSKRSRGLCAERSTSRSASGILYLLVRPVPRIAFCRRDIDELVARSLVTGLLRYNYESRSTVAMALETSWIYSDL